MSTTKRLMLLLSALSITIIAMIISFFKHSLLMAVLSISLINANTLPSANTIQQTLAQLESSSVGRLGISAINTANNEQIEYHANERFPFCSTGKVMVVAAILAKNMNNPAILDKSIHYTQKDINDSGYAPITEKHLATGMTVKALCEATMDYSDNLAMNLLVNFLGGTKEVNFYARSIGDNTFRLDRSEPKLNTAIPNDMRDTTTPAAMEKTLQTLTLGDALAPPQREQLLTWLKNNTTGESKIRAGVPKGWIVGDKTGGGAYGTTNDIAILFPPHDAPIIMVIYFTQNKQNAARNDAIITSATRLIISEFAQKTK